MYKRQDHGYYAIKTRQVSFPSGIIGYDYEPYTMPVSYTHLVMTQGYYMPEIATQFFIMGIVSGVIGVFFKLNDMKLNDIATSFKDGAKDLIGAALVVAMAQGIMQVLGGSDPTTPTVINTIMYNISNALSGVSGAVAAVLMYLFQSVFNFFVVSGTGQAAITMPIMAPLSDLLGVSPCCFFVPEKLCPYLCNPLMKYMAWS